MHAAVIVIFILLVACGGDVEPNVTATSTGSGGGQSCQSTQGLLEGDIYRSGENMPRPGALALLRQMPRDVALQVQADGAGHYQVMLEAGAWLVDGEDGPYCTTMESRPVTVEACGEHTMDVVLDCVLGG